MSRAKTIDRLELTRQKFGEKLNVSKSTPLNAKTSTEGHWGLSECPMCKRMTLKHEGGCVQCTSCGWSACG